MVCGYFVWWGWAISTGHSAWCISCDDVDAGAALPDLGHDAGHRLLRDLLGGFDLRGGHVVVRAGPGDLVGVDDVQRRCGALGLGGGPVDGPPRLVGSVVSHDDPLCVHGVLLDVLDESFCVQRVSEPVVVTALRPASSRATGTRKGEHDT